MKVSKKFQLIPLNQSSLKRYSVSRTHPNSYFSQRSSIYLPLSANSSVVLNDLSVDASIDSLLSDTVDEISQISREQKLANSINFDLQQLFLILKKCNTLEIKCNSVEDELRSMKRSQDVLYRAQAAPAK